MVTVMRRRFPVGAGRLFTAELMTPTLAADADAAVLKAEITENRNRAVTRLQEWIRKPAIARMKRASASSTACLSSTIT